MTVTRHDDLKDVANESDWFATIMIPTPSNLDDARARFELEWRNARRELSDAWDDAELEELDELVGGLRHGDSASLAIVHAHYGSRWSRSSTSQSLRRPFTRARCRDWRR